MTHDELVETVADLDEFADAVTDAVESCVNTIREVADRVEQLKAHVEVRDGPSGVPLPAMRYMLVWVEGRSYEPGDVVTYAGTIWHCGLATKSRPGTGHEWQMMAKGGASTGKARAAGII